MNQTPKHASSLLFSPEDEERLACRLGLYHASYQEVSSWGRAEPGQQNGEHAEEALARQESEHVLCFEYLGL